MKSSDGRRLIHRLMVKIIEDDWRIKEAKDDY